MLGEPPGETERDGIYYEFCRTTSQEFFDFSNAIHRFGGNDKAFDGACQRALSEASGSPDVYDAILVDEAQDFSPSFLRVCYTMLREPKKARVRI